MTAPSKWRLVPLLRRVGRAMQSRVASHVGAADISYPQWNALLCLDQLGSANTRALAARLAVTPYSADRLVAGLEARGLVVRDGTDPRATGLRPTPAGLAKLREAAPEIDRRLADALAGLTDDEVATLVALLGRLADCFDPRATPLVCHSTEA
jgi:DNA-binding MarR family transcriptional regulator